MAVTKVIDAHMHFGITHGYSYEKYLFQARDTNIGGMVVFPPVPEIYDRDDPNFQDNDEWQERRRDANQFVLDLKENGEGYDIFPFFFVWNDFPFDQILPYVGIKWHRHPNEPIYQYSSQRCKTFINILRERGLPIVFEEEFEYTMIMLVKFRSDIRVIIPHLGRFNGGYRKLEGLDDPRISNVWEMENVYTDTSLAPLNLLQEHIDKYGHERVFFGSDYPFGNPKDELEKVQSLNISKAKKDDILRRNFIRLMKGG